MPAMQQFGIYLIAYEKMAENQYHSTNYSYKVQERRQLILAE